MVRRVLILSLAMSLLAPIWQHASAGCATYPATGIFQLSQARTATGAISVQFNIHSDTDEPNAELVFRLRQPGEPVPVGTTGERRTIALVSGKDTSYTFEFVPTTPGQYTVYAVVVATDRNSRRGFEKLVTIDVPGGGGAPVVSTKTSAKPVTTPNTANGPTAWDSGRARATCPIPDDSADSRVPRATSFKVYGTFKYTDKKYLEGAFTGTQELPIRDAFVQVFEVEPGDTTQLIGFTYTDTLGKFSYTVPDNSDGPPSEGKRDIRLIVNADSADAFVSYLDSTETRGATYGDFENWPGGDLWIGTVVFGDDDDLGSRFNILDNAQKAQAFARSKGETTTRMRLKWEYDKETTSYFKYAENSIVICGAAADSDDWDDDVILHECGHYMMNKFSFSKSPGGNHSTGGLYDPKLAWSEGWATYFSGMVDYNRFYVDHSASDFSAYNLETSTYDDLGDRNEDAVTGALWDIYDGPADGVDTLSDGSQRSWNLFTQYFQASSTCTFRDFYNGWKLNYDKFDKVDTIANVHGMPYSDAIVTYPTAAGVSATIGNSMNIKWDGFPGANVHIEMLKTGNPNFLISASTLNDGSYLWTLPSNTPPGPNSRIRVYTTDQNTFYDDSDNFFRVYPKPVKLTLNSSKTGSLTGLNDEDWYSINITTGKTYTIKTFAGGLTDSFLTLYGPNTQVTFIAEDDDGNTGGNDENMSQIIRSLAPGTYYMQVEAGFDGQAGNYSIRISG